MADPRQARAIVDALPAKDAVKMLEEVTDWLESLNRSDSFALDRRLRGVELLDGDARRQQRELTKEYLSTPRVQKFQENRLWNAEYGYLSTPRQQKYHENQLWNCATGFGKQLEAAYALCARQYDSGFSGITSIGVSLPVIMAQR